MPVEKVIDDFLKRTVLWRLQDITENSSEQNSTINNIKTKLLDYIYFRYPLANSA